MNFFTKRWRTLLLAAVLVVGAVCVSGSAEKPAALVGQWVHVSGVTTNKPEKLEMFSDGTGVIDGEVSMTWKVENKRLMLLTSSKGLACDYKVAGYELTLKYDDDYSATFVKKDKLEEYKKKEAELKFAKISGTFTDSRNGRKYRTVKIGGKTWMAENVNYQPKSGNSWCYENEDSNCKKYGRLYDWNTAKTVCPAGWHLPSREEWNELVTASGGNVAGKALKSTYGWNGNGNGTDEFGFSALPGGSRRSGGNFNSAGYDGGHWWTATEGGGGHA